MPHTHPVIDNDLHFSIDTLTREISNGSKKVKLMQGDHASEVFTFEILRYVDGHDMSLCNKIAVHYINVGTSGSNADVNTITDAAINDLEDKVVFSWTIHRTATKYAGSLNFLIKFSCVEEDGTISYQWNTDIFKGIAISAGIDNEETLVEDYHDILQTWRDEIVSEMRSEIAPLRTGITRVESLDTENIVQLRDLETGLYVLYGYFSPYADSHMTMTFDNTMVVVTKKNAGSHLLVFTATNSKVNFLEIMVDSEAPAGYTYTRTEFVLLDMHNLIEKVGELADLNTEEKSSIVAAINEIKDDLLFFGIVDKPGEETLVTGKMVLSNGHLSTQEMSDAHTNIRVTRGTRIEISNAYCAYSRSICAYDKDGNFVKVLGTNLGTVPVTVEYDVDDYDTISVTSKTGESITVRYVAGQSAIPDEGFATRIDEENATKDGTGNYVATPEIQLDQSAFTDGYLVEKHVVASTLYYYSDYIPVVDEQYIQLNNIFVGGFTIAVFYDADKNYLSYIRHTSTSHELSTTVTVPYNAQYMRFTALKSRDFSTISVSYVDKIERNYKPINLINRWYSDSNGRINTLFAKSTSKPICCIVDDDSPSAEAMETFAALMEQNGVSGTIACLTKIMETNDDLKAKLLELERRGHQVVLHGYTQNEAYKNAQSIGDSNYKIAEDDFVHGLRDLMTAGFVDCKFWVSPYGVAQKCMQDMARKWGMECLITAASKEFNGSDGKFGRYEIQRSGLNADDSGTLTQEQLLALADQCAEVNGWLLINTHIANGWNGDFTRITEFIDHCKEKGFEFMTLGDAWRIRKPIYDWYDTF